MRSSAIAILAFLLAGLVSAGDGRWTTNGPYGDPGPILFHPADPNIIFSGSFRSTDAGLTWISFRPPSSVEAFRIANKPPYSLVSVGVDGPLILQKSSDLGATWSTISTTPLPVHGSSAGLSDFQMSESNPDVMYTSITGAGVLTSVDGGKTWAVLTHNLPKPAHSFGLLQISPTSSTVVYYIYSDSIARTVALLKTVDGGRSWASIGPKLEFSHGMTLRIDPKNQDIVYTGTSLSQYKTTDGGKTWKRLTLPAMDGSPVFWINPRKTANVWTTGIRSYVSANGGNTWRRMNWPRFNHPYMVAFAPRSRLMLAPGLDLLRSTDNGRTWKTSNKGLEGLQTLMLDVNPIRPGRILVPASISGIYRSTNSGSTWNSFVRFNWMQINIVRSHPAEASTLGVITSGAQFSISTNGGGSWKTLENRSFDFAFHPQNERTIYFSGGKSTDGGATFHAYSLHPGDIGTQQVVVDPKNGENVYLKTNRSLYESTNGGDTWSRLPIHAPNALGTLLVAPSNSNFLYMGSNDGIYTSSNAGTSWVHHGKGSGFLNPIAVDPGNPQTLYATYYGFLLRLSTDGGKSFTNVDRSGLPETISISGGSIDPMNPKTLHLATSNGVYSYTRP